MPNTRHIVWDWNGTLNNDVQAAVNAVNILLRERGLPLVDVSRHRASFGFPVRDYYISLGFRLENEDWELMARQFNDAFHSDTTSRLFRGTVPTLTRLAEAGVTMSVLSACEQTMLDAALERAGIRHFFVAVSGLRHRFADSKIALARNHLQNNENVLMVGDTTHDKEVADAAGWRCVLVAAGYQSRERLEAAGAPVLGGIGDVAGYSGL